MRRTATFETVAAGSIALGALLMAQAVSPGSAQPSAHVRADGAAAVTVPTGGLSRTTAGPIGNDDVTWGS
ncbi:hypothetical protein ACFV3R_22030 [Streptomyces sp. NPDC059740]|uniref:hypothetical protein n=1 Tax=Streptomyces sp. NPDC059740 TaxID=3346926 RepID=UPI00365253F7